MLIDSSKIPRETYYACPYCHSPLDVIVRKQKNSSSVFVKASDNTIREAPKDCRYHFGYLKSLPRDAPFPDGCLTCPVLMKCVCKR